MRIVSRAATRALDQNHSPLVGSRRRTVGMVLIAAAVAVAPAVATYVLVHARLDAALGDFVPSFWNDQVAYWHRIGSFAAVGLDTGYYSPDELAPPVDAIRYGPNGPWFPAIYGAVAVVTGWTTATSIPVNLAVLALGFLAFVWLARLQSRAILLAGLALLTLWPVLLYIPTASQEPLQQAIAMVLAGVFVRAIRSGPELSIVERTGGVAAIALASTMRFSWAILLPCLLLLYARRLTRRWVFGAVLGGTLAMVGLLKLAGSVQPAGSNAPADTLNRITTDPVHGIPATARLVWEHAKVFVYPGGERGELDTTSDPDAIRGSLEITGVQSWEIIGIVVIAVSAVAATLTHRNSLTGVFARVPLRESLFHLVNLGVVVVAALALYIPAGYYRVLGAHLLLSILVLVASGRALPVIAVATLNLIMLPSFLNAYYRWKPNFDRNPAAVARERAAFSDLIRYDDHARNPWCNTLLLPVALHDWRVTLVPPGIGISFVRTADVALPLKSRYVLLTRQRPRFSFLFDRSRLRQLRDSSAGTLYENPDSACFRSREQ